MPNPNYDDIFTTTLENRAKKLADNVSNNNALLAKLMQKGKVRDFAGGSKILEELEYGQGDMTWYSGYDTITYTPKQLFTSAEFGLKLCAVPVAITGEDMLKNSGEYQIIDLFERRIDNGITTMKNQMAAAIYGDGTGSGGKSIGGLKSLVADSPNTGTVGGINRATAGNEFWRNKSATATLSVDNIKPEMNKMYLSLCRGSDRPDLIVTGNQLYSMYEESLMAQQRYTDTKMAQAGFENLKFKESFVVFDGGDGGNCPDDRMYFLNTNYLYFRSHKDRKFKVFGGNRQNVNQDAKYNIIGWAGNMTASNLKQQGVLING